MTNLPVSWERVEITQILEPNSNGKPLQQGWSPQCESFPAPEGKWGVLKTTAIQDGQFWDHENKSLPDHFEPRPQIEVKQGDILMTCAGPRSRCGVVCLVERTRSKLMISGKMYRFRPHPEGIASKYLAYFIQTRESQVEIDRMKTGISDSGLNLTHDRFAALKVPVAPFNEQKRIVAKIEELFSELDKSIDNLETAWKRLKAYRHALLKYAFEGKLTKEWRAENPEKLEAPQTMLSRIRAERQARYAKAMADWSRAVVDWRSGDEAGPRPSKPTRPKVQGSPEVPGGFGLGCADAWPWLRLGDISDVSGGLTKNPKRDKLQMKMKYLRVANVYADRMDLNEITEIGVTKDEYESLRLKIGDLLVVEGNGSIDQIGRVAVWGSQLADVGHQNHLIRVRLIEGMLPRLFLFFLMSPLGREMIIRRASSTSGLYTLSISKVADLAVPVPSSEEQEVILAVLAASLSEIEKTSEEIEQGLARCNALRQSILKKAFSGKLVAQDPNDEPASILLERIRVGRDSNKNIKKKKEAA